MVRWCLCVFLKWILWVVLFVEGKISLVSIYVVLGVLWSSWSNSVFVCSSSFSSESFWRWKKWLNMLLMSCCGDAIGL